MADPRRRLKLEFAAVCVAVTVLATCQSPPPQAVSINELNWVADGYDPVAALTAQPATCQAASDAPANAAAGKLLFHSPLLLGGQASKAGLSCASCHRNGRANQAFMFESISGQPGTADVTHGLFGPQRADEINNPVAIPDLALPDGQIRVARDVPGVLEAFLQAQITEEFGGALPAPVTIASLAAYIRTLDHSACAPDTIETRTWQTETGMIQDGLVQLASESIGSTRGDRALRLAIRTSLGRLHERYPQAEQTAIRSRLTRISQMVRDEVQLLDIHAELNALKLELEQQADQSLYNPVELRRALLQAR